MSRDIRKIGLRDADLLAFTLADVDDEYRDWLHDIEVVRYLDVSRHDRSFAALRAFVSNSVANSNHYMYKIVVHESAQKVGTISLHINTRHRIAEFGYLIGEHAFLGSGIAMQAQVGLFDFAFGELGLRKLSGRVCIANTGSNFNCHRLGFRREGIRRAHFLPGFDGDEPTDMVEYACLAEEWLGRSEMYDQFRASSAV